MERQIGKVPAGALWSRAEALYGEPGIASACIALQDRWGLDVNLLLLCAVAAPIDATRLDRMLEAAARWHDVVAKFRQARRAAAALDPTLRPGLLAAELDLERAQQRAITEGEVLAAGDAASGRANLDAYVVRCSDAAAILNSEEMARLRAACG
ncbi:MAG: hypothetical protein JWM77_123 [Rhodospirillales bacterium]|nr:hypothetical protein [Rhodospirillales bacterium]